MNSALRIIAYKPEDPGFEDFIKAGNSFYPELPANVFINQPSKRFLIKGFLWLQNDRPIARAALYLNPDLKYQSESAACFGAYECVDDVAIAGEVLNFLEDESRKLGAKFLIGPMEGSTWNNYRFNMSDENPPFFLEPYHHLFYPKQMMENGFEIIGNYRSHSDTKIDVDEELISRYEKHLAENGMRIRNMDTLKIMTDLRKIARFCNEAFAGNFLFTPVDEEEFVNKFMQIRHLMIPRLIIIIENEAEEIQGLSFSIPDVGNTKEKTLVVKSMAKRMTDELKGCGSYLGAKTYQVAKSLGFEKAIHAFMHDDNTSKHLSIGKFNGSVYRQYQLFGKRL
ncbi:MAG: hypothetical protein GC181_00960 [Bacteroidetes bacterium]|nr:hypothetical protein [Bacteroidota bacterium]